MTSYCQALVPNPKPSSPQSPQTHPNLVQPSSKPKLTQRGLGLTLKSCRPPTHHHQPPITFKHEGGVSQKSSESKNGPEWSNQLVRQKKIEGGQREGGHGVVHHLQQEYHQPYLMHHPTCQSKKILWISWMDSQLTSSIKSF